MQSPHTVDHYGLPMCHQTSESKLIHDGSQSSWHQRIAHQTASAERISTETYLGGASRTSLKR